MLIAILRYMRGYVRFRAEGAFVERFLNLLIQNGFAVWSVSRRDYTLEGCVFAGDYKRLRRFARRTGVRLRVAQKLGAPFFARENRRRAGVLLGIVLFVAFLAVMNRFVWRIEVVGNESVSSELILQTAKKYGLRTGVAAASVDARRLERSIFLELDELSWIAVNIEECNAVINVRECVPPPQMFPDNDGAYNVVAARDGVIRRIITSAGQEMASEGDIVRKGDIIVSGILGYTGGRWEWKHARADVYAETKHTIIIEIPLEQTEERATGEHIVRSTLEIFGAELPLPQPVYSGSCYEFRDSEPVRFLWFDLPVRRVVYDYMLYDVVPVTLTGEQAKAMALDKLEVRRSAELGNAEILRSDLTGVVSGGVFRLRADYLCIVNIAAEQPIDISGRSD